MHNPYRQEIWLVEFQPNVGAEISKSRPAVVVSISEIENLPLRIVVPLREWKDHHKHLSWIIKVEPSSANGLVKFSAADCAQVKSFSIDRFSKKLGILDDKVFEEVLNGILLCIGI